MYVLTYIYMYLGRDVVAALDSQKGWQEEIAIAPHNYNA